ncbi:hypothetical protein C8R45DRAFT_419896 [Mycena sanguinolenta]|nr:hypothetical protein C8R45DRAFT_419896 [Mycena sanguinolenta]
MEGRGRIVTQLTLTNISHFTSASPSTAPTATVPFLPSNENEDINSPAQTSSSNPTEASVTAVTGQTTASPASTFSRESSFGDISASSTNTPTQTTSQHSVSSSPDPIQTRKRTDSGYSGFCRMRMREHRTPDQFLDFQEHRARKRTDSGYSGFCRMRMREHRTPDQFLDFQEHRAQIPSAKTVDVPAVLVSPRQMLHLNPRTAVLEPAEPQVDQSNSQDAPVLGDTDIKRPVQSPHENSADTQLPDRPVVVPAENVPPQSGPPEAAHDEETMSLRMRRLEARVEALLAVRLPDSSPPSYYG